MIILKESLVNILQYASSDVYRDLTIMSETLSQMSDEERKLEIIKFARITRSLFFRLLAITQWAISSKTYIEVEETMLKLEQYSQSYIDIADRLYYMSNDQLPNCTIPASCLQSAVDILSSGTFNRLPQCFSDMKLSKLNQMNDEQISAHLSTQLMDALTIYDFDPFSNIFNHKEYLHLRCPYYQINVATLNNSKGPWRLFGVVINVKNAIEPNKSIYNELQINYLLRFIESKMNDSEEPFLILYKILQSFCNMVVLEILQSHVRRINYLTLFPIECSKRRITITYWPKHQNSLKLCKLDKTFKLFITLEEDESFDILHEPPIDGLEDIVDVISV